jgi:hypothetical protein
MPRVGVRNQRLVPVLICAVISASVAWGAVWRRKSDRRAGTLERAQADYDATANHAGELVSAADMMRRTSCPIQRASGCIECRMPKLATPMAHTHFTDHFIRVNPVTETNRRP